MRGEELVASTGPDAPAPLPKRSRFSARTRMARLVRALLIGGAVLVAGGLVIDGVTERYLCHFANELCVSTSPWSRPGIYLILAGLASVVLGLFFIFSKRANFFVHKCAECGREWRDHNTLAENHLDNLEFCSVSCTNRGAERRRIEALRGMIQELENAARNPSTPALGARARKRLEELAEESSSELRAEARAALQRTGGALGKGPSP